MDLSTRLRLLIRQPNECGKLSLLVQKHLNFLFHFALQLRNDML